MLRRSRRDSQGATDELAVLRQAVINRAKPDVIGAELRVKQYVDQIAADARVEGRADAKAWIVDRLRLFVVLGFDEWITILQRIPEGAGLREEWTDLRKDTRVGAGDLIAWWWNLQNSLFKPLVEDKLAEMRGALTEGVLALAPQRDGFTASMVDWTSIPQ